MKTILNPRRHVVSDYPPAAGQRYRSGPVKKWAVIGAFVLLAIGGGLFMLTVQIAVLLIVPLFVAGALYGGYRALQNRRHRDLLRLEGNEKFREKHPSSSPSPLKGRRR